MITVGRANYGSWLRRLIAWDGLLPASIAIVPIGIEILLPHHRGAIEVAAVALPITAFFLRVRAGKQHIDSNQCSTAVRRLQFCAFCVGILPLVLIDCVIILFHVMPKGAMFEALFGEDTDWLVLSVPAVYLTSMAVAMYPGKEAPSPSNSPLAEFGA